MLQAGPGLRVRTISHRSGDVNESAVRLMVVMMMMMMMRRVLMLVRLIVLLMLVMGAHT